ncbi:MAG: CDP-diacylglycerol--serine O-phosphatidyltransferase [Ignavibacteria bacterium]|nr:CDP-diacylglycerol--serine O-phosphatidyltransferase [Ignavibacteria bacterium]
MIRLTRSIVPNSLTIANLFSGFVAIIYVAKDEYMLGALFVLLAAIFDMVDGITARLVQSASEFGVQLDSLSDAVSFGVVPSFMLYKIYFYQFGDFGLVISALPLICGVLRLARFNVQTTAFQDKKFFNGLAIPASAFFIISYIIFYHRSDFFDSNTKQYLIFFVTILSSILMVSTIKFYNAPRPNIRYLKQYPIISSIFFLAIILSIATKGLFIFPFFIFYIVGSIIRHYYLKLFVKKNGKG